MDVEELRAAVKASGPARSWAAVFGFASEAVGARDA